MAFTLLHTADFHLGKSFSALPPERAAQRRADLLATLRRVCQCARDERVQLLCVAGDLFDHAPTPSLLAITRQALAEAEVPVLLIPGNHDPLEENGAYMGRWPENVRIATAPGWQRMAIDGAEVWAFGYVCGAAHRSAWREFPGCGDQALLALHAACLAPGLGAGAGYFSFTPREVPACGYLALGHHHRATQVGHVPLSWYAGTPEPLEPETTPAAALLVTLGETPTVRPLPVATRRHRLMTLDVHGLDADDIWERALAEATEHDLLTLRLVGVLDPAELLDVPALRAELSVRCFAADIRTEELLLPETAMAAEGALGLVQALARARLAALEADSTERARWERAVRYAVLALEGRL